MKLGMQVGLGPGHIVLDADPTVAVQECTFTHTVTYTVFADESGLASFAVHLLHALVP